VPDAADVDALLRSLGQLVRDRRTTLGFHDHRAGRREWPESAVHQSGRARSGTAEDLVLYRASKEFFESPLETNSPSRARIRGYSGVEQEGLGLLEDEPGPADLKESFDIVWGSKTRSGGLSWDFVPSAPVVNSCF